MSIRVSWGACVFALAALVAPIAAASAPDQAGPSVALSVAAGQELGPLRHELVGLGWHEGGAPISTVGELEPYLIRMNANVHDISTAPDAPLKLERILARVAAARSIGAEPLVELAYMPAWLGQPNANGRDPTRVKPADLDAWQEVVHDVVFALATAPQPARYFEAWNEPDIPIFWQDTPAAWIQTIDRSARAILDVEAETGLDISFAGPATAVPDPTYLVPFLGHFRDTSLPLDAVTWHYYGNYPFFGPDGVEFEITEPIQPVLGQENPLASPAVFGGQIELMRTWVEAGLAGSGRPMPDLFLDEWNLSAAGYDDRHDTHEGAAFAAGTLSEMQTARLDASAFFRGNDTRGVIGEHGIVKLDGSRKPSWWTLWLWQRLPGTEVAVDGDGFAPGVWATAAIDDHRLSLLVSSFRGTNPQAHSLDIALADLGSTPTGATVRRIDADHSSAEAAEAVAIDGTSIQLVLPPQGVALVEITFTGAATTGPAGGNGPGIPALPAGAGDGDSGDDLAESLPSTGAGVGWPGWTLAAVGLGVLALTRRARAGSARR